MSNAPTQTFSPMTPLSVVLPLLEAEADSSRLEELLRRIASYPEAAAMWIGLWMSLTIAEFRVLAWLKDWESLAHCGPQMLGHFQAILEDYVEPPSPNALDAYSVDAYLDRFGPRAR